MVNLNMKAFTKIIDLYKIAADVVLRPLKACGTFFLFTLLMCYVIAIVGYFKGIECDPFLTFLLPISDCYLINLFAYILKKIRLHWIWYIFISAILFAELFTLFYYHSKITVFVLQLIFETTPRESSEFVSSAFSLPLTWHALGITFITATIAFIAQKKARRRFRLKPLCIFLAFALVVWSGIRQMTAYSKLWRCFMSENLEELTSANNNPRLNSTFMRFLYGTAFNKSSSADLAILEKTVQATEVDSCSFQCPLIVLVIGESFTKYHSSLYGYHLPTSPRLGKLKDNGQLYICNNAISPYNLTSHAFKYMFTTWDDGCDDSWLSHTLFPAVFKKAGYSVYFITNQFTVKDGGFHDAVGGTILNRPLLSQLQFTHRNQNSYFYDHELLTEIPPIDSLINKPSLLIFHMNGQHQEYEEKYTPAYARFTSDDEKTPYGGEAGKQVAAHYDNATCYNDYVVDSLFAMFKDTETIALYLSDHGEEVYDWRNQYQRTYEANMPPEVARYQYEIPFMFYTTESFSNKHPEIIEAIQRAQDLPFISSDLCQILFGLAGISHKDYRPQKDLLSKEYDKTRKRIIRDDVEYDKLILKCK